MGFSSRDGLGGPSTKVASVDCLRCMYVFVFVSGLISEEAASLTPRLELETSSRHGFSSSIDSSDDTFHSDEAIASSARPPGEMERSEVTRGDGFSEVVSNLCLRVLEGNSPHFLRVKSGDLSKSFFDIGSSSGRL